MHKDNHNPKNPGSPRGNPDIVEAGRGTRFAPGRSGNPSGRPPSRMLTSMLNNSLPSPIPARSARKLGLPPNSTHGEAIVKRLILDAENGNIAAIREVFDRTEGKPPKEVVTDENKNIIVIEFEQTLVEPLGPVSYTGLKI